MHQNQGSQICASWILTSCIHALGSRIIYICIIHTCIRDQGQGLRIIDTCNVYMCIIHTCIRINDHRYIVSCPTRWSLYWPLALCVDLSRETGYSNVLCHLDSPAPRRPSFYKLQSAPIWGLPPCPLVNRSPHPLKQPAASAWCILDGARIILTSLLGAGCSKAPWSAIPHPWLARLGAS